MSTPGAQGTAEALVSMRVSTVQRGRTMQAGVRATTGCNILSRHRKHTKKQRNGIVAILPCEVAAQARPEARVQGRTPLLRHAQACPVLGVCITMVTATSR